jgi:hypothetical protein
MEGESKAYTYSETLIRENHKICLRSREVKLILDLSGGGRNLFDLIADPYEERDISQERPELAASMEADLNRFVAAQRKQTSGASMTPAETASVASRLRGLGYID